VTDRSPTVRVQHALGALLGAAAADALGAPYEFGPGGRYRLDFPSPQRAGIGEQRGGGPWAPAEFTDDTQMAVALGESLVACGGLDPADVWARWRAWAASATDVGVLTANALAHPDPDGAAARAHRALGGRSAGNGTVMRNVPVVLFTLDRPIAEAIAISEQQAALTHHDPATHAGAAIHTVMVRAAILGEDPLDALARHLEAVPDAVRAEWSDLLGPDWSPERATTGNGTVWTCLAQAVWCLRHATSFEDAVVRAVDLGDDADTVACVTGSLAGAHWGIQAVPSRWTTYLHGSIATPTGPQRYGNAELQDLARRLLGRTPVPLLENEAPRPPVRVHDEVPVHAANWLGAATAPTDWAVVSLCRTGGRFADHPVRREVYLVDRYHPDDNHDLDAAVRDAVDTVDAFLAEDPARPVLVHCHGGRSRTALVLKAWAMRRHGWTEARAHEWLTARWPVADRSNDVFVEYLERGGTVG
jgi:ADP-ribosyl-[dinitrogen reductase] hydrolase